MTELATKSEHTEVFETTDQTNFSPFNDTMIDREFDTSFSSPFDIPTESETEEEFEEVEEFKPQEPPKQTVFEEEKPKFNPKFAELTSKTVINILEKFLPKVAFHFAEIDTSELDGIEVKEGTIEGLEELNEKNLDTLQTEISDNLQLIAEPLKAVMESRNMNISPETMLIMTVVFMVANLSFTTMKMRKQNEKMILKIIALNTPKETEKEVKKESEKTESKEQNANN